MSGKVAGTDLIVALAFASASAASNAEVSYNICKSFIAIKASEQDWYAQRAPSFIQPQAHRPQFSEKLAIIAVMISNQKSKIS
jgi:hypothetical protein